MTEQSAREKQIEKERFKKMKIEQEFLNAMKHVYPTVEKDSPQFKSSRLLFYMGAYTMVTAKSFGQELGKLKEVVDELRESMRFANSFAKKGLQPEDTLADYVEGKDQ